MKRKWFSAFLLLVAVCAAHAQNIALYRLASGKDHKYVTNCQEVRTLQQEGWMVTCPEAGSSAVTGDRRLSRRTQPFLLACPIGIMT